MAIRMRIAHLEAEFQVDNPGEVRALLESVMDLVTGRKLLPATPPAPPLPEIVVDPPRRTARARGRKRPRKGAEPTPRSATPAPNTPADVPRFGDLPTRIAAVLQQGPQTGAALARLFKASVHTVRTELERMTERGLVHSTGIGKGKRWHLGAPAGRRQASPREPASPASEGD